MMAQRAGELVLHPEWGTLRVDVEVAAQQMDAARATENALMVRWISNACSLETYRNARYAAEKARTEYTLACMRESLTFVEIAGPDLEVLADDELTWEDTE